MRFYPYSHFRVWPFNIIVLILMVHIFILGDFKAHASPFYQNLPNADAPYPFMSKKLDIQEVLKLFGQNLNIATQIDEAIEGNVTVAFSSRHSNEGFLNHLGREFDFIWYFGGNILHMVSLNSLKTEIFSLKNNDGHDALRLLQELNIYQSKFSHRVDGKNGVLVISAPKDYITIVQSAIDKIEEGKRKPISILRGETTLMPASNIDQTSLVDGAN